MPLFILLKSENDVNNENSVLTVMVGTGFEELTQEDVTKMMNHINSYKRKKLNDKCPYEAFSLVVFLSPVKTRYVR
jgi:transposase, IS30 family